MIKAGKRKMGKKFWYFILVLFLLLIIRQIGHRVPQISPSTDAVSKLGAIGMFEETYFSENGSYLSAAPNPMKVPLSGVRLPFDSSLPGWKLLGRIIPNGQSVYHQYEIHAGMLDAEGKSIIGGKGGLVSYTDFFRPGGQICPKLNVLSAAILGIPSKPLSKWYFATAVGDVNGDGKCSLFVKIIQRSDILILGDPNEPSPDPWTWENVLFNLEWSSSKF